MKSFHPRLTFIIHEKFSPQYHGFPPGYMPPGRNPPPLSVTFMGMEKQRDQPLKYSRPPAKSPQILRL